MNSLRVSETVLKAVNLVASSNLALRISSNSGQQRKFVNYFSMMEPEGSS